jgi:site-specific DNA-methyltransferase (adenine-specific)
MFSFWGDTVLDPFCGTGTTMLAAMKCGRNSIGIEIDEEYCRLALNRLKTEGRDLFRESEIEFSRAGDNGENLVIGEEPAGYKVRKNRKTSKRKV